MSLAALVAVTLVGVAASASSGAAAPAPSSTGPHRSPANPRVPNPLRLGSRPFSCPDPDVFRQDGTREYVAACTSDYGEDNPGGAADAAFPMYVSSDLLHWRFRGFVFSPGRLPPQTDPADGRPTSGRFWSPEIHRIAGRWVVYFAAQLRRRGPGDGRPPFALFVAWTNRLFGGRWHNRLLHRSGQFNGLPHNDREAPGGVIDPTVARDPSTGGLLIAYARQSRQIYLARLRPDGLRMLPGVHLAFGVTHSWECDHPGRYLGGCCCVEGPVLAADPQPGVLDLFFNAASAWTGTYKVGIAFSADPLHRWVVYPHPLLRSGNGLFGPGIGAQPVLAPDGATLVFFHVQLHPAYDSQARYLARGHLHFSPGRSVRLPGPEGRRGSSPPRVVAVPQIDAGVIAR